ncbi:MAG: RNA methyltransferase [Bacteroidetes bacterium]|nr:RNA methyltransferase [Bacteroidota bacterium]
MISKSHLKLVQALKLNKYRKQMGLFIAEGPKIVNEFIHSRFRLHSIFATHEFQTTLKDNHKIFTISQKELERISLLKTPNQVVAIFHIDDGLDSRPPVPHDLTLVLDDIRDPGNMGTIIRTADWYGIQQLVCSDKCVDIYNPKVVQATMGSLARVNVHYTNLENYLSELPQSIPTYGAIMGSSSLYELKLPPVAVLVIGNESHGISPPLLSQIKHQISIPSFTKSDQPGPESLNASVATAILCSEFRRQNK